MGYSTEFSGAITIEPKIKTEHFAYLTAFSTIRHMKRKESYVEVLKDDLRIAVGLPVGDEGQYYVGSHTDGQYGQGHDDSVIDHNNPADGVPGLWCQWEIDIESNTLQWDGGEKFYNYTEWLKYLIDNFFAPWGYTLNGSIEWAGDDIGVIEVVDNIVTPKGGKKVYELQTMAERKLEAIQALINGEYDNQNLVEIGGELHTNMEANIQKILNR